MTAIRGKFRLFFYAFVASVLFSTAIFNTFAIEIEEFNAKLRLFLTSGETDTRYFTAEGIPYSVNPRIDRHFVSPFYVVHYGLIYSEHCQVPGREGSYHWLEDSTVGYWPQPPMESSLDMFRSSARWIVENTKRDAAGNAHLFYDFDWPYANYPGGILKAPWWSGLTDAHALTLLLRAWDCFQDRVYLDTAQALYESAITPVSRGGSLIDFDGYPWIEEYVDPRAPEDAMSRVLNGMVYAYHGIRAYEEFHHINGMAKRLKESIVRNIGKFDLGYWSYYDAIGTRANLKYHGVNLALLLDERFSDDEFTVTVERWRFGWRLPLVFYLLEGEFSYAKLQFIISYLLSILAITAISAAISIPSWGRKVLLRYGRSDFC